MSQEGIARRVLRRASPQRLRVEVYRARRRGLRRYWAAKLGRERGMSVALPSPGEPFDVGGRVPIVLHESTVRGLRTHLRGETAGASELDVFKQLASGRRAFLDIGAGSGVFTATFCALTGGRAHAFEPSPVMFGELSALIELNPELQMTVEKIALGERAGTIAAEQHGRQYRNVASAAGAEPSESMSVETLDAFVARHAIEADFAKVDVEGMELEVLRGGAKTFGESIQALMLEVHPRRLGSPQRLSELHRLLDELGFELLSLELAPIDDLAAYATGRGGGLQRAINVVGRRRPAQLG
jgi:FkbM family methyltransferase